NWKRFYRNVGSLPLASSSVLIRALIKNGTGAFSNMPVVSPNYVMENMLYSIDELVSTFDRGEIRDYGDAFRTANLTVPDTSTLKLALTVPVANTSASAIRDLEPPAQLKASSVSESRIDLSWPRTEQGIRTSFTVTRRSAETWDKPVRVN